MSGADAKFVAQATCAYCGWKGSVGADDVPTLRAKVDAALGAHVCCRVCQQAIVEHDGRWWHAAAVTSTLPRGAEPWSADLDADHEAVPAYDDPSGGAR